MHEHGGRPGPARPPRPPRRRRRLHLAGLAGTVLALTLAVAACGGGVKTSGVASLNGADQPTATSSPGASNDRRMALNWARCMRQHGINLPDPQLSGDNIIQRLPTRAEQNSAKFKAAEQACKQYLPNGGRPAPPSAQERQQALAFARCMRQHGIDMPDPQITANGIDQPLPLRMARDDPRLTAAEQACHQYGSLGPIKSGGPPSGGRGK
jgi:hypothetical protein